jgi:hypothetical protein
VTKKQTLQRDHGWKAKEGYSICVLDRGAVRLEFPSKWIVKQHPDSVQIHDSEPPNDDCVVSVSRVQTPGDAGDVPLRDLVAALVAADERQILNSAEIVQVERGDLNIAWSEIRYIEPEKKREAFSRIAIGRGAGVHCLITFDFWADQATKFAPVWDDVLSSLMLGQYVVN